MSEVFDENDVIIEGEIVNNDWFVSAINGNLNLIKENYKFNDGKQDEKGCTALMYCANLGHLDCLVFLIKNTSQELLKQDKNGKTALIYASQTGQLECIKLLVSLENNIKDFSNKSPYDIAVQNNHIESINFLKKFNNQNNNNDDDSGRSHKKDLIKLEKANKEMENFIESQKVKDNVLMR